MNKNTALIVTLLVVLAGLMVAGGCVNVEAKAPREIGTSSESTVATPPPADGRTASQLMQDNNKLRSQQATLEKQYSDWRLSLDKQKDEINALKNQRELVKKERDRYKKALKKD